MKRFHRTIFGLALAILLSSLSAATSNAQVISGACRLPSGSLLGTCVDTTSTQCATYSGTFFPNVSCSDINTTGRCARLSPYECEVTNKHQCNQRAGQGFVFTASGTCPSAPSVTTTPEPEDLVPATPPIKFTPNVPIPGLFEKSVDVDSSLMGKYVSAFYIFFAGVAGIIAIVVMMWGGFHYITSAGNSQRMSEGKDIINNALVGLVLLFTSYLLLNTINPNLTRLTLPTLSVIPQIVQRDYYCESAGPDSQQMKAVKAANALCGTEVTYGTAGSEEKCVTLQVTDEEKSKDIACIPNITSPGGNKIVVTYQRVKAKTACEDNDITQDGSCTTTQSILGLQDWLKGGCKQADVQQTLTSGKDICLYLDHYTCQSNYSRVSCSVSGTVADNSCWRDGKPRVYTIPGAKIRAHCVDPRSVPEPIEKIDGICCQQTKKDHIYCVSQGCATNEVEVSCPQFNTLSGQYATRPFGIPGPTVCGENATLCCAPLVMQYDAKSTAR